MLSSSLPLVLCVLAALASLALGHAPTKRDDNLPARVPYVFPAPGTNPVADALRARRPNGTLLDLDGVLLQDDSLASGWNALASVVRDNNSVPAPMRELFILRTGVLNNAAYVWLQHESVGREAGLTLEQLREIRLTPAFLSPLTPHTSLTPELSAAMLLTDFMTNAVKVPQPVFDGLHKFLNDKQMVDAVGTVGTYNLVSRFVVALDVDSKMDVPVPIPTQ
ncbi:4-carboxymuconolactone decarboxylase [Pilatotrama ljubarskyi]|nr:4-carboxymuconolactone decarboxylase [Pilatotrama ljubarskyi]